MSPSPRRKSSGPLGGALLRLQMQVSLVNSQSVIGLACSLRLLACVYCYVLPRTCWGEGQQVVQSGADVRFEANQIPPIQPQGVGIDPGRQDLGLQFGPVQLVIHRARPVGRHHVFPGPRPTVISMPPAPETTTCRPAAAYRYSFLTSWSPCSCGVPYRR